MDALNWPYHPTARNLPTSSSYSAIDGRLMCNPSKTHTTCNWKRYPALQTRPDVAKKQSLVAIFYSSSPQQISVSYTFRKPNWFCSHPNVFGFGGVEKSILAAVMKSRRFSRAAASSCFRTVSTSAASELTLVHILRLPLLRKWGFSKTPEKALPVLQLHRCNNTSSRPRPRRPAISWVLSSDERNPTTFPCLQTYTIRWVL
jgi:hypothetical protein